MSNNVKIIKPITVTNSMIVSTNLFDTPLNGWYSGGTYNTGDYVSIPEDGGYSFYKSLQNSNTNHPPSTSPTWWVFSNFNYSTYVQGAGYALGARVLDPVTNYVYESLTANNNGVLDPVATPPWLNIGVNASILPAFWLPSTTYALGEKILYIQSTLGGTFGQPDTIVRQIVYTSLQAGNIGNDPFTTPAFWATDVTYPVPWLSSVNYVSQRVVYTPDGNLWQTPFGCRGILPAAEYPVNWFKVKPNNRTAMFDDLSSSGTEANKQILVTVASGVVTSIGLVAVNADVAKITVRDGLAGAIVFQKTIGLSGGNASNGWDYYFSDPTIRKRQAYISGIPPYLNSHVTLELTGTGAISIGNFILGVTKELGLPEYGVTSEILDFSKKTTDDFGRTTFVRRGFKRTMDCNMFIEKSQLSRIENLLEDVRSTPILVIASEDPAYSETAIRYCFYKSFRTEINYPTFSFCSIQFEGLI
jgi:hypothetical protein